MQLSPIVDLLTSIRDYVVAGLNLFLPPLPLPLQSHTTKTRYYTRQLSITPTQPTHLLQLESKRLINQLFSKMTSTSTSTSNENTTRGSADGELGVASPSSCIWRDWLEKWGHQEEKMAFSDQAGLC